MQKCKYQNHDITDEVPFFYEKKKTPSESVRRVISSFEAKTFANNTKKIAVFGKTSIYSKTQVFLASEVLFLARRRLQPFWSFGKKKKRKTSQSFDRMPQNLFFVSFVPFRSLSFFFKKAKKKTNNKATGTIRRGRGEILF